MSSEKHRNKLVNKCDDGALESNCKKGAARNCWWEEIPNKLATNWRWRRPSKQVQGRFCLQLLAGNTQTSSSSKADVGEPLKTATRKASFANVNGKNNGASWRQIGDGDALQNNCEKGFARRCWRSRSRNNLAKLAQKHCPVYFCWLVVLSALPGDFRKHINDFMVFIESEK